MTNSQTPPVETLSEAALADIEARAHAGMTSDILALCQTVRAAWRWKREALPLLKRYDDLAETFGGKLGSSKVKNFEQGVAALHEQLAEAQEILRSPQKWMQWCDHRVLEENESLRAQLAQVEKERSLCSKCKKEINE